MSFTLHNDGRSIRTTKRELFLVDYKGRLRSISEMFQGTLSRRAIDIGVPKLLDLLQTP